MFAIEMRDLCKLGTKIRTKPAKRTNQRRLYTLNSEALVDWSVSTGPELEELVRKEEEE